MAIAAASAAMCGVSLTLKSHYPLTMLLPTFHLGPPKRTRTC